MDAKINKQLRNDEIILRCIPRGGTDATEHPKQRVTTAMVLNKLTEFIQKQSEFNNEQRKHNANVDSRLGKLKTILNKVIKVNNLKTE
jgi:hypothetical protein